MNPTTKFFFDNRPIFVTVVKDGVVNVSNLPIDSVMEIFNEKVEGSLTAHYGKEVKLTSDWKRGIPGENYCSFEIVG